MIKIRLFNARAGAVTIIRSQIDKIIVNKSQNRKIPDQHITNTS